MNDQTRFHFYASTPEACGYLPDKQSVSAFANPYMDMDMVTYNNLIQYGFRRSGGYLYRPHCPSCKECVSVRVSTEDFQFSRNDKRTLKRNSDLSINAVESKFSDEHFELYRQYINARHKGGSMENPSKSDYHRFLICDWSDTVFIEFRLDNQLVCVAATDITSTGYSAVYTYFSPDVPERSLGHLAILTQMELAQQDRLPYLYLGYWIQNCDKMSYKSRYKPAQGFINEAWVDIDYDGSDTSENNPLLCANNF